MRVSLLNGANDKNKRIQILVHICVIVLKRSPILKDFAIVQFLQTYSDIQLKIVLGNPLFKQSLFKARSKRLPEATQVLSEKCSWAVFIVIIYISEFSCAKNEE